MRDSDSRLKKVNWILIKMVSACSVRNLLLGYGGIRVEWGNTTIGGTALSWDSWAALSGTKAIETAAEKESSASTAPAPSDSLYALLILACWGFHERDSCRDDEQMLRRKRAHWQIERRKGVQKQRRMAAISREQMKKNDENQGQSEKGEGGGETDAKQEVRERR